MNGSEPVLSRRPPVWALATFCGLVAAAAYVSTLSNGFVWDDFFHIVDNPRLDTWPGVATYFRSQEALYYRPIIFLSYAAELRWWGRTPYGFHVTNLVLHAVATLLVCVLGCRLGASPRAAAIAGGLFALHPAQVDAVAYISGRTDLLVAVGGLATWLALGGEGNRLLRGATGVAGTALAVLSKESGFALIPFILWIVLRRRRPPVVAIPALATALIALVLRPQLSAFVEQHAVAAAGPVAVGRALATYLGLVFWPRGLHVDRLTALPTSSAEALVGVLCLAGCLAGFLWLATRRSTVADCAVWAAAFYLPVANLVVIYPAVADWALFTPEHNLYVPFAGLALLGAFGFDAVTQAAPRPRRVGAAVAAVVLVLCAASSVARMSDWKDEERIFAAAAAAGALSPRVHYNLGNLKLARGDLDGAAAAFETALRREPRDGQAWGNLAVVRQRKGDIDGALAAYSESVRLRPSEPIVWENLASLHMARGELKSARLALTAALRLDPRRERARAALEALERIPDR